MAVLDSSFLIDVLRNRKVAVELLDDLEQQETLYIPAPTVMELWEGVLRSKHGSKEKRGVEELLAVMPVLDFDGRAAKRAAEINVELAKEPIEPEDAMIAGITLVHGEALVTRDAHFARIPGLKVLKY